MPRTARASVGGICYHVLNRGNARGDVFYGDVDYREFVRLIATACERIPMRVMAYCLMPNHFHLVLWPRENGELSRWMQWLLTAHVRRHHRRHDSSGHVWQGRFKAFPIQRDEHLLTVIRYVERNALRAGLVRRAENWPWCSLAAQRAEVARAFLHPGPLPRPRNWLQRVNAPQREAEVQALRQSVNRGTPFGSAGWARQTVARLGLESTVRPRGRPRGRGAPKR
jgi:putative transposase